MRRLNWKPILISGFFLLCLFAWITPASAQSWSNGYAHRRAITIDHTRVPNTDQTNFPFLFSGTYSYLATTANGGQVTNTSGYDIIFTYDAAGSTTLAFEQESYSASTGAVSYWIAIPTLSHATDTVIYMFYGNSSVATDQSNKTAVWDSNYKGVWHFNQTPNGSGSELNSTSNGYNGTPASSGISLSSDGIAGSSLNFNGASNTNGVTMSPALPGGSPITVSIWMKTSGLNSTAQSNMITKLAWATTGWNMEDDGQYNSNVFFRALPNYTTDVTIPRSTLNNGIWHYLVGTIDSSNHLSFFLDGSLYGSVTPSSLVADTSDTVTVGGFGGNAGGGLLTEVRISSLVRSADWIATEYNNQNSPSTFYTVGFADFSNGYSYGSAITIDHTKVPNTDQISLPVLISGTYSYLATTGNGGNVTNSSGYDIVFTSDASGLNPLAYERESYNSSTGAIIFWVKVPTLSHTADTMIYMFYGNSSVMTDQSNAAGVWDTGYKGVWHLPNGTILSANDSTGNGNNGVISSPSAASGEIDGGASFNGTSDYIDLGHSASLNVPNNLTVSGWVRINSYNGSSYEGIFGKRSGGGGVATNYGINFNNSSFQLYANNGNWQVLGTASSAFSAGTWYYIVGTFAQNGSNTSATLYKNGAAIASSTLTGNIVTTSADFYLGESFSGGEYGHISLDEVRVSGTVRSADWIAAEYNNQNSSSTFYSVGASTAVPNLTSLSPTSGSIGTSVTITGINFGSTQGSSTVAFNGVATTPTSWSNTQIVTPVPGGTFTGNVVVNVSNLISNGLAFTDTSAGILGVSPASGAIGIPVTITGVNFGSTQGSSTVTFNGTAASPTSWSNTQIVGPVPSGTSSGNVVVTVSGAASNGFYFTVTVPAISTLSPTSGPTGTSVTISGSNFGATQGSSSVTFNGTAATPTSWSSTSIVVPVPAAANTGNVVATVGVVSSNGESFSVVPSIASLSPLSGLAGIPITITGTGFGPTQGTSTVTFNGTSATPISWSNTSILVTVPSGATKGNVVVTVGGLSSTGANFTVLPTGWLDQDVGNVGLAGSATYSNGVFTVKGAGTAIWGSADSFHFAYQSLSGDGTIVARVVSVGSVSQAGVMIRETLNSNSTIAFMGYLSGPYFQFRYRTTTGSNDNYAMASGSPQVPYWVKVVRAGSTFSGYASLDGVSWTQTGSSQTISMATSVYIGLSVTSGSTSTLGTAIFDSVSVTSTATPAPVITSVSATSGPVGAQISISGTGFGAAQGSGVVMLNGAPTTVNTWSDTSIVIAIPTGATSGPLAVLVGPDMNASNPVTFTVTSQPLPPGWLDQDVGNVGIAGSAAYSTGTFTVKGSGSMGSTTDSFHFVYQPLPGDGTIIARVVSRSGLSGLMIRETLAANSTYASVYFYGNLYFSDRATTGGDYSEQSPTAPSLPYWVMLSRSGSTFTGYSSPNGLSWTQIGTSVTINMAQDVYIGMIVNGSSNLQGTFDNVSVNSTENPAPAITSLSATTGTIGIQVVIAGSNFGASQGSSLVLLNDVPMTVNSWSDTSITVTIASGAASGYMAVAVGLSQNGSNAVYFTLTTQPLPSGWLDQDVGTVSAIGSATYSNGTFLINGVGGMGNTTDAFHFVYQPLLGDGTIIARVVSTNSNYAVLGVMIRETLAANATYVSLVYPANPGGFYLYDRTTTGGNDSDQFAGFGSPLPYWVKLSRSGNTFTSYISADDVDWRQVGSSVTISMAQNAYIGMIVDGGAYVQGTFDNVSVNSTANPAPVITGLSATSGTIGSQVVITGSNFGASQGNSIVFLSGVPMTVNSWSDTSITVTIASGAASGYMAVAVGPSLNGSNVVGFTVTTQPLPSGWLDHDVGSVGTAGSAGYSGGTFTVNGFGTMGSTADAFHFVYQPLSGDGTIIARVVSANGVPGVMIRETLTANSTYASVIYSAYVIGMNFYFYDRTTTGGSDSTQVAATQPTLPYWVMLNRSGSTFTGYISADGVYWTQLGPSVTINMAQNVYVGMIVDGESTGNPHPSTFDNVSVIAGTPYPTPNITGITPTNGGIGASVTVSGSGFGATQGSSSIYFNGASSTSITSWSDTQIVATVPSTATTGPITVVVNGIGSNRNVVFTFYNPVISSLVPPAGPVGGSITITGSGFGSSQGNSSVQFNGLTASTPSSWSDTSITVTVPSSATSGPVTVIEGNATSSGVQFTVIEAATVTGLSPASAPTGASVVITGTGFGPSQNDSTLTFYGATATNITSWSDTSITAPVPTGAVSGPVSVTVAGITATGPVFTLTLSATLTDSLGNTTAYASEIVGGQFVSTDTQGSGCSTCTVRGDTVNTFDSRGNRLATTDPAGHTTTNTYDSSNNLLSQSVQLDSNTTATTSYTYNSFGEVLTVTDPLGNVTTNAYDSHGNLLSVTSPAPNSGTAASVTNFAYNSLGELTTITDPLSHVTTMTYTTAGLIATITDAQGNVTTYGYDAKGNRTSITDALSHQTTFAYDAMSRLTTITYPDSTTSTFAYDSRGRRTSVTDQNGKTTTYAYDDADRLTSVTDAASHVTYYAYDTEDNLTSITDANSNQTAFTYDAFGRVTQPNFPSSLSETYQYDADNNLTSKTDRKGQTITYLYDALNRLTSKTYPDTTAVDYVYDLVGKIQQVNDPTGTYAFAYDNMGRLIGTTTSYSFLTSRNFTNAYTYDAASNRTGFTDPESGSTTYTYDTLNRLTSLAPPSAFGSGSFGFSYDALSRRTQMTRPNSVTTSYTYDNLSRLTSVLHQLSGSTIDGASYTLDSAGNRTAKTDQLAAVTSNYTYDAIYQLTQVTQANNTTESYSYDPVGNRTASLGVSSYTTNASNELTATSNASYTYDSNGNTLTKTVGSEHHDLCVGLREPPDERDFARKRRDGHVQVRSAGQTHRENHFQQHEYLCLR